MKSTGTIISIGVSIALLCPIYFRAEIIGSDTTVSIISNSPVFPARDTDNNILSFGYLQGGFTLQDATTSCTFDSVFPVSGFIDLNGGTLYLLKDLVLAEPLTLDGLGRIIGNNHTIKFCESVTSLPSDFSLMKDVNLIFSHDVELNSTVSVQGNCYIQCASSNITFNNNASLVIDTGATLEIQHAILQNIGNDASISCIDNTGLLYINNTTLALTSDWTFAHGSIHFKNSSSILGSHNFYYTSNNSSEIEAFSTLSLDQGITYNFGKTTTASQEPLILAEKSSALECKQCTLHIASKGAELTTGKLNCTGSVIIEIDATDTQYGLVLGDHTTAANDIEINLGSGCNVTVKEGVLTYNNIHGNGFLNSASSSSLKLNQNAIFNLASSCTLPNNTFILNHDGTTLPTMLLSPETACYLNDTYFTIPGIGETIYTGCFKDTDSLNLFILNNNNSIYLANGSLVIPTKIMGSSNIINGNGSINSQLSMNNNQATATLSLQGPVNSTINLNGATLTIGADTTLTATDCFLTSGTINVGSNTLTLQPISASQYSVPIFWTGTGGNVKLMQDTTLTTTWTFSGNLVLDAGDNAIIFQGGAIAIATGSNLIIKNAHLNNITQNSIYCEDNTGSITLYNITWEQQDNFAFTHGSLNYKGSVFMTGQDLQFIYQSTQTGVVNSDTTITLDNFFTFDYAPSNSAETLWHFTDLTSKLEFSHSTLYIESGLRLTNGQIIFKQQPNIYAMGTGLTLGDETITDSSADMQLVFLDNTFTYIQDGSINYQNMKDSSLQMWTGGGFYFSVPTTCKAYQTINAGQNGQIIFDYGSLLYVKQSPGCPNISDVVGDKIFGKPEYVGNLCDLI